MPTQNLRYASGGVVDAIKRYDKDIRIRWSWEKQKWCVEGKAKRWNHLIPPVVRVPIPGIKNAYIERIKPEKSDHYISYHDGYYPILWSDRITWNVYGALINRDTHRFRNEHEFLQQSIVAANERKLEHQESFEKAREPVVDAAFDKYKFLMNKPWMNPVGGGS